MTALMPLFWGVGVLLVAVPLVMAAGFVWLALAPVFAAFVVVMVVRRAGEYALVRPGREMLFTVLPAEDKYKDADPNVIATAGGERSGHDERGGKQTGARLLRQESHGGLVVGVETDGCR